VVIPAYNEQETVRAVAMSVRAAGYPVVVIDDGSSDRTTHEALAAGACVVTLPMNLGVGGALRCGFRWAVDNGYTTVIQCDADGQHDPTYFSKLADVADATGAHLVVGSRFTGSGGFEATAFRRIAIRFLSRIATRAVGGPISDASSGFRLIRSPLLECFARNYPSHYLGDTFEVLVEAGRAGYCVVETPVLMHARAGGVPSAGSAASLRFLARALLVVGFGTAFRYPAPSTVADVA
jgi:glycosyltransferase involved in cell wall biosynthesis